MSYTATRRLEFDAAHRITTHESKCQWLHGHRYAVEVTCVSDTLDIQGRAAEFSLIKQALGGWIDSNLDHGTILTESDAELCSFLLDRGHKVFTLAGEPSAEGLAELLYQVSGALLPEVRVAHIRVFETPNCWADYPGNS